MEVNGKWYIKDVAPEKPQLNAFEKLRASKAEGWGTLASKSAFFSHYTCEAHINFALLLTHLDDKAAHIASINQPMSSLTLKTYYISFALTILTYFNISQELVKGRLLTFTYKWAFKGYASRTTALLIFNHSKTKAKAILIKMTLHSDQILELMWKWLHSTQRFSQNTNILWIHLEHMAPSSKKISYIYPIKCMYPINFFFCVWSGS